MPCCRSDVEEITQKTGNYKQFAVFVDMLSAALRQDGDGVNLDVLTYADLQVLKSRKSTSSESSAPQSTSAANNKRYVILTYASQFDRCAPTET